MPKGDPKPRGKSVNKIVLLANELSTIELQRLVDQLNEILDQRDDI